jgi:peptidylprolyl isomerase
MRIAALILLMAATAAAASAQTPAQPAAAPAQPAATAAKPATATAAKPAATAAKPAATAAKPAAAPAQAVSTAAKLPFGVPAPGIPPVKTVKRTLYTVALQYQEIKIGDGAPVEPKKLLSYNYTLWAKADGHKIDSTDEHPRPPLKDKEGKPVMGSDGKPVLGDPVPSGLVMGQGGPLLGWELGFEGMKARGKRRIFIPWQLGLGERAIPARDASHPAIPARSDLILDVELVDVTEPPPPPQRPGMPPGMMRPPMGARPMPGAPGAPPAPAQPGAPAAAPKPAPPAAPAAPPPPAAPAQPAVPAAPAAPAQPQQK